MKNNSEILIYQNAEGEIRLDVRLEDETVWLTQAHMAELFGKSKKTISEHIRNVFNEGELDEKVVVRNFRTTTRHGAMDGKTQSRDVNYYNLDVIISVGYRVRSQQGTQFRIWATQRLKEYIVKGFALNDARFKSGESMNYFSELQERIRVIRLSERFFYQKIKDIYTTSIDYDPQDEKTVLFFKTIQNKLLWAISEQTAAELVYRRADAELPLMGMLSFDIKVEAFPVDGFAHYHPAEISASTEILNIVIRPNQTTLIDIVLKRLVHSGAFTIQDDLERGEFKHTDPGSML